MESSTTGQPDVKRFRNLVIAEMVLLFAQFQMGMSTNLFITPLISLTTPWSIALQAVGIEVLLHIWNGMAILILSVVILVVARRFGQGLIWKLVLMALIFIGLAIFSGFEFFLNGQNDAFSITMAMSFLAIYTLFFGAIYVARNNRISIEVGDVA
jgi:hypothetical protein